MFVHIPNILTLLRILIIPVVVLVEYFGDSQTTDRIAAALFITACFTDFLDGYLARAYSIQSKLGALLDPIADKLLVGALIVVLVANGKAHVIPATAIICREILVSGLREFLATLEVKLPVTNLAKAKTVMQMLAILLLVIGDRGADLPYIDIIGKTILWIAAILTIITGYVYLKETIEQLEN